MQTLRSRRIPAVFLLDALGLVLLFSLVCIVLYQQLLNNSRQEANRCFTVRDLQGDGHDPYKEALGEALDAPRSVAIAATLDKSTNNEHCTMGACFDISKCRQSAGFKVYVYPDIDGAGKPSSLYGKILSVIRSSHYYTPDPTEACLFVTSIDTLDRDRHSDDYVKDISSKLDSLTHWNGGLNHIIFNQYSGTWPDYEEELDFNTGKAILAKASFNISHFRRGFDVSLPLLHKEHPERGGEVGVMKRNGSLFPLKRKFLLAFKGKRYLYGPGKESRSSIYHLHNGKDVVMVTTCKHNRDWYKRQDKRCSIDNELFDKYDYTDLLVNSSFCLVPRGRRLGSFRFLESLQASCIPVSLSNSYVLPFHEVIYWSKSTLDVDERQLLQVTNIVRTIPATQLLSMRLHTQFVWDTYFRSVERVVMTTLEIIHNRIFPKPTFVWNSLPGGLAYHQVYNATPHAFPFYHTQSQIQSERYTVVITCTHPATREAAPLIKLIRAIAPAAHLDQIIINWIGAGPPRVSLPSMPVPVRVDKREERGMVDQLWPLDHVTTDAVLHLREDVDTTSDEVEFGFATWRSFRDRLVGYVAHKHYWDPLRLQWSYTARSTNEYSLVLSGMVFYHRYYGFLLHETLSPRLLGLANQNIHCLDIVLNFMVADITGKAPIKVSQRKEFLPSTASVSTANVQRLTQDRVACLNMVANAYGSVPLVTSSVRMDPVLFKDNVSMFRKEYRQMELDKYR